MIYDGFFDAVQDNSGAYDRAYNSEDFTGYFEKFIGSGVCVHENPDSMLVSYQSNTAIVSPGYLFINGYWLKNDADYTVALNGSGVYAISAHLDMANRRIDILSQDKTMPEIYPNSLVLAYITIDYSGGATVTDTRYNTDICGVLDSIGGLSDKVAYAIDYIDTQIEARLKQAEADIKAQSSLIDDKIAEVNAEVEKLEPPPIGSIKFSASRDVGAEWLPCNGDFVNEADYPELVAALGQNYPRGDKFKVLSVGEVGRDITNAVLFNGRLWVYSFHEKKLYGVATNGTDAIKTIAVTSSSPKFNDMQSPKGDTVLALSICDGHIFLSQVLHPSELEIIILGTEFTGNERTLVLNDEIGSPEGAYSGYPDSHPEYSIPYVVSVTVQGEKKFYCAIVYSGYHDAIFYLSWQSGDANAVAHSVKMGNSNMTSKQNSRKCKYSFNRKNNNRLIYMRFYKYPESTTIELHSVPSETYKGNLLGITIAFDSNPSSTPIMGKNELLQKMTESEGKFNISYQETRDQGDGNLIQIDASKFPVFSDVFPDAAVYLWDKDMWFIFVGGGILFTRKLSDESKYGFLNTVDVLGNITQFGYMEASADESTLYIVGQDSANIVHIASLELGTNYDYATDGAWLPVMAMGGIPAYIKAKEA